MRSVVTQPVSVKTIDELKQLVPTNPANGSFRRMSSTRIPTWSSTLTRCSTPSNLELHRGVELESNSIYAYNNKATASIASWHRGTGACTTTKFSQPGDDTAWLRTVETPPVSDQLQAMVSQVQTALPDILALTNKLSAVLDNAANATSNLERHHRRHAAAGDEFHGHHRAIARTGRTRRLGDRHQCHEQLQGALTNVNTLLVNTDTNLDRSPTIRLTWQCGRHHQQPERAGPGELQPARGHLQNRHGSDDLIQA